MKRISDVVFDIGGVVISLNHGMARRQFAKRLELPVEELNTLISTYQLEDETESLAAQFRVGAISADAYLDAYIKRFGNGLTRQELIGFLCSELGEPISETLDLLKALRGKVNISCFSNSQEVHWNYLLREYPVMKNFQPAMASHLAGLAKPDSQVISYICDRLSAKPEACLLIDDAPENVASAQKAGMNAILYESPKQLIEDLKQYHLEKE